eukprot:66924-Pelagomonas_calceolata.AAC.7
MGNMRAVSRREQHPGCKRVTLAPNGSCRGTNASMQQTWFAGLARADQQQELAEKYRRWNAEALASSRACTQVRLEHACVQLTGRQHTHFSPPQVSRHKHSTKACTQLNAVLCNSRQSSDMPLIPPAFFSPCQSSNVPPLFPLANAATHLHSNLLFGTKQGEMLGGDAWYSRLLSGTERQVMPGTLPSGAQFPPPDLPSLQPFVYCPPAAVTKESERNDFWQSKQACASMGKA